MLSPDQKHTVGTYSTYLPTYLHIQLTHNMDEIVVAADRAVPGAEDAVLVDGVLVPVVDHGELQLEGVGEGHGALGAALVRGHHNARAPAPDVLLDPRAKDWLYLKKGRVGT